MKPRNFFRLSLPCTSCADYGTIRDYSDLEHRWVYQKDPLPEQWVQWLRSFGSDDDLRAPADDNSRPVGEPNDVRIAVGGSHFEHRMNGVKHCSHELSSED